MIFANTASTPYLQIIVTRRVYYRINSLHFQLFAHPRTNTIYNLPQRLLFGTGEVSHYRLGPLDAMDNDLSFRLPSTTIMGPYPLT